MIRPSRKLLWRLFLATLGFLAAAWYVLPRVDTTRFAGRVQQSLEEALGRKVEIGKITLDLLAGPGFTVDRVVIHDDPAVGLEPFAYVETLEARVSFTSFWAGRLKLASLRLVNPSVNLVRPEAGGWNFVPLLERTASAPADVQFPSLQVRGGRINFKVGDTKSIFYLTEATLDADPPSTPGGPWRLRFEGEPARSDRAAQGFGALRARGTWKPGGSMDVSVELERSSLGELIRLTHGHDVGLHGQAASRLRLQGPVSEIAVSGRLEISDIHRWDLLPPYSGYWAFNYSGKLDLASQRLELATTPGLPIRLALRASGFLTQPIWAAQGMFSGVPVGDAVALARQMGLAVPAELDLSGEATGVLGYSPGTGLSGMVSVPAARMAAPDLPPVQIEPAEIVVAGEHLHLSPTPVRLGSGPPATLEADYRWATQSFDAVLTSRSSPLDQSAAALGLLGDVPLLRDCRKGAWRGMLRFQKEGERPGVWSGLFDLENALYTPDGFAVPVELISARASVQPGATVVDRMRGQVGPIQFAGSYRHEPQAARPHQFRFQIKELDTANLEEILEPTLQRDESFLTRALRLGRAQLPAWLKERQADALVQVGTLHLSGLDLSRVRAHALWDGPLLELRDFSGVLLGGGVDGVFAADLRAASPGYRFKGRFRKVEWAGGAWEGTATLATAGKGLELLRNLRAETVFSGRSVTLAEDARFQALSGRGEFSVVRGAPQLRFSDLKATLGEDVFAGKGASGADGRLLLELISGERELRLGGTLAPLKLELLPPRVVPPASQ